MNLLKIIKIMLMQYEMGNKFMSASSLSKESGITMKSAYKWLHKLEVMGVVKIKYKRNVRYYGIPSNLYNKKLINFFSCF